MERVSVGVLEHRRRPPVGLLRRAKEFDAARRELLVRLLDVVGVEGEMREPADVALVLLGRKEHQTSVTPLDPELDPALMLVERLIGVNEEPDLLGPEGERAILI